MGMNAIFTADINAQLLLMSLSMSKVHPKSQISDLKLLGLIHVNNFHQEMSCWCQFQRFNYSDNTFLLRTLDSSKQLCKKMKVIDASNAGEATRRQQSIASLQFPQSQMKQVALQGNCRGHDEKSEKPIKLSERIACMLVRKENQNSHLSAKT